jgi:hypothetical protein
MKQTLLLLTILLVASCKGKPAIDDDDKEYIRTTIDLLRTRAHFGPQTDSAHIVMSLDSVYRRHHTTRDAYTKETSALAGDPKHAELVFNAINDSVGGMK